MDQNNCKFISKGEKLPWAKSKHVLGDTELVLVDYSNPRDVVL